LSEPVVRSAKQRRMIETSKFHLGGIFDLFILETVSSNGSCPIWLHMLIKSTFEIESGWISSVETERLSNLQKCCLVIDVDLLVARSKFIDSLGLSYLAVAYARDRTDIGTVFERVKAVDILECLRQTKIDLNASSKNLAPG